MRNEKICCPNIVLFTLCVGCAKVGEKRKNISVEQTTVPSVEFRDISNPKLLDYVEENVYASLLNQIDNRKYF